MPAVVATEMPAATHNAMVTQRSTTLRARNSRWTLRSAADRQNAASATPATSSAIRLKVCSVP